MPPRTHKGCRKTLGPGFPHSPPIRHRFPSTAQWSFWDRSGSDPECAENTCFPLSGCVSIGRENDQNARSTWVSGGPVPILSAYAYQEAVPLVPAVEERELHSAPFIVPAPAHVRRSAGSSRRPFLPAWACDVASKPTTTRSCRSGREGRPISWALPAPACPYFKEAKPT